MKQPLIILTGPTAVGKTAASIGLAKAVGGEIISADSMQVYRNMDIGTAKITREEMQGIPHFLIDEYEPCEEFNIVIFQKRAKEAMQEIYERGHIPIIAGGTGFYIQSVVYDVDFGNDNETERDVDGYRAGLEQIAGAGGTDRLHKMLEEVDREAARVIHPNNVKRVIRALEYYHQTGSKISEHNEEQSGRTSPYNFAYFVLNDERANLYRRIDERVDMMLACGLENEVRALHDKGYDASYVSMQGIGYKQMLDYVEGRITLDEAVYRIKRDTRHFAKRQITWFKREKEVCWINKNELGYNEEAVLEQMIKILEMKQIIGGTDERSRY